MPREMRQIMFRAPEIMTAITEYHRQRAIVLPQGIATGCRIVDEPALSVTLTIRGGDGILTELTINAEVLAAALILYCIDRKIPLPAEADKRLQKVGDDGVALIVIKRLR
ncbi:MAG TPA: hypothetical protein VKQ29_15370 [Aliidongia sp.]|nr:hypothetical protein [Aliidongia sp.]